MPIRDTVLDNYKLKYPNVQRPFNQPLPHNHFDPNAPRPSFETSQSVLAEDLWTGEYAKLFAGTKFRSTTVLDTDEIPVSRAYTVFPLKNPQIELAIDFQDPVSATLTSLKSKQYARVAITDNSVLHNFVVYWRMAQEYITAQKDVSQLLDKLNEHYKSTKP